MYSVERISRKSTVPWVQRQFLTENFVQIAIARIAEHIYRGLLFGVFLCGVLDVAIAQVSMPEVAGFVQVGVAGRGQVGGPVLTSVSDSGDLGSGTASSGTAPAPFVSVEVQSNNPEDVFGNANPTGAYAELSYYLSVSGPVGQTVPLQVSGFGRVTQDAALSSASASLLINNDTTFTPIVSQQVCLDYFVTSCGGHAFSKEFTLTNFAFNVRTNDRIFVGLIARAASKYVEKSSALVDPVFRIDPSFANASQFSLVFSNGITQSGGTTTPPPPAVLLHSGDYNGDGRADVIWRHQISGQVYGMLLNGFAITDAKMFYHEPNTAWRIVQEGDLDGNGRDDLLWWNNQTGQAYWMPMNGLSIAGGGQIHQEPNTAWQIVALGDLNGDGKEDLVWWNNATGQVYGMLMNGDVRTQEGMIYHEPNTNWQILAARDLSGDGQADLLWRNVSTGQVYLMPMSGLTIAGGAMIHHEPNLAWNIVAVGDFNNDKKNDLIWWNQNTGQVWGMLMNGYLISSQGPFYHEPNTAWRIVASGDYTGDGNADLLWRNSQTGQIYEMPMNGLAVSGGAMIYQEANADWRIVADAEISRLPPPSRSLPGAARFAPLEGEPLNPYQPFDGEPVNAGTLPAQ